MKSRPRGGFVIQTLDSGSRALRALVRNDGGVAGAVPSAMMFWRSRTRRAMPFKSWIPRFRGNDETKSRLLGGFDI